MIYCYNTNDFPSPDKIIEQVRLLDENIFEWILARTNDGLFIKYLGDKYFSETYFNCELSDNTQILLKNTDCLFINDTSFDMYIKVRDAITMSYTDDIWDFFNEMFVERLNTSHIILDSEQII